MGDIGGGRDFVNSLMGMMAQGSTDKEALDFTVAHVGEELTKRWPEPSDDWLETWGKWDRKLALFRRVQQPDVVLYVNDYSHGFASMADTVRAIKVPVLDLRPSMHAE